MALGQWRALVWPWTEKKGKTGICFLSDLLEPVTGRRKDEARYSLSCFHFSVARVCAWRF